MSETRALYHAETALVDPRDAAFADEQLAQRTEARKVAFWSFLERLADEYGVELQLGKRSAGRWSTNTDPPQLLAATVRFERRGYARSRRKASKH